MFDHYLVNSLASECQEKLQGYHVQKIWARNHESFILKFRGDSFFLLNLSPQKCHGRLETEKGETQDLSFPFLLALRKTLESAKLISCEQINSDRILLLRFQGRSITLDPKVYHLYLEFMGRHGNAILTEEDNTILYAYKQTPYEAESEHIVRSGYTYTPPEQNKPSPLGVEDQGDNVLAYRGFYRKLIKLLPQEIQEMKVGEIHNWISEQQDFTLYLDEHGNVKDLHQFTNEAHRHVIYPSLSELLTAFFTAEKTTHRGKGHLNKILNNRYSLVAEKIKKLEEAKEKSKKSEDYKRKGELLLAYLHSIKGSPSEVELIDYYDEKPVVIELDSSKSPLQNAQHFYKQYEKLQRSLPMIREQIKKSKEEKLELEQLLYNLEQVETPLEIQEISQEMHQLGLIKKGKKKERQISKPRSFNYQGFHYEVGKNNHQNDELRRKTKNKDYVWFHAKQVPGSHVLLHLEKDQATDEALEFGAKLASFYSRAKGAPIAIDYTTIGEVQKPKGAPSGFVIYRGESTIQMDAKAEEILPYES